MRVTGPESGQAFASKSLNRRGIKTSARIVEFARSAPVNPGLLMDRCAATASSGCGRAPKGEIAWAPVDAETEERGHQNAARRGQ